MITFSNMGFDITPTKSNRIVVRIDVTTMDETYNWMVYAPIGDGSAVLSYLDDISQIIENDIQHKEVIWSGYPKTEMLMNPLLGIMEERDIPKSRIVHPTMPDYIEALSQGDPQTTIDSIFEELPPNHWHYPSFLKRISAPVDLVTDDMGIKMYGWFQLNGLPIVKISDSVVQLYCNTVLPQHQAILSLFGEMISVEDRP